MNANVHQGERGGQAVKRPHAKASFDARRLFAMRKQLAQALSEGWSVASVAFIEEECRALGAGLIAGEQVAA